MKYTVQSKRPFPARQRNDILTLSCLLDRILTSRSNRDVSVATGNGTALPVATDRSFIMPALEPKSMKVLFEAVGTNLVSYLSFS